MTQTKTDFKKTLDPYQASHHEFRILDVPPTQYLMIDGHGDPNTSQEFRDAVAVIYPVGYKLKFASKLELGRDYVVMPLEGLWWSPDMEAFTAARDKSKWDWTLMMMVPDWITPAMFETALAQAAAAERHESLESLENLRLETLTEGRCVQTLHIGSYDDETAILDTLHHQFIPSAGLTMRGKHHEIYLSDARKVRPDKLRTILRQPVS